MPGNQQEILVDGAKNWAKVPYQVRLDGTYATLTENIRHMMASYSGSLNGQRSDSNVMPGITDLDKAIDSGNNSKLAELIGLHPDVIGNEGLHPETIGKTFFQDTRLGANDAINCLWQFNRDDDIVYRSTVSSRERLPEWNWVEDAAGVRRQRVDTESCMGEGRVYSSTTQRNQSIAYFSFGIPMYSDIATFLAEAADESLSEVNTKGYSKSFQLGRVFADWGSCLAFPIIFVPLKLFKFAKDVALRHHINRFYDFKRSMHAYYSYVDSICAQWLVATGLYEQGAFGDASQGTDKAAYAQANKSMLSTDTLSHILKGFTFGAKKGSTNQRRGDESLPPALRATGPSIFDIISLKARILGFTPDKALGKQGGSVQEIMEEITTKGAETGGIIGGIGSIFKQAFSVYAKNFNMWAGAGFFDSSDGDTSGSWRNILESTMAGATLYVGFRIEKSVSASESFSNESGPSALAEKINGAVQGAHDNVLTRYASAGDQSSDSVLGKVGDFLSGAVKQISSSFGMGDTASAVMMGALYDIPEEYKSSSFNKSHSLSFQLRAPYGDIVTIYQTIIVPLALILAGALPRAAGKNSYQQPFLCECYCKGIFSVPMGLIESVSLERGSSEFGWTYKNLPTSVNVNISIKDLSPIMYMMLKGATLSNTIFSDDNSFDEYLNTLAGVGTYERISGLVQFRRKTQLFIHTLRNRYLNPNYWASSIGLSDIGLTIGGFVMENKIPKN